MMCFVGELVFIFMLLFCIVCFFPITLASYVCVRLFPINSALHPSVPVVDEVLRTD
jgi:hypothetical protein